MLRTVAIAAAFAAAQVLFTAASAAERAEFATPEEAKALLEKAVVAIRRRVDTRGRVGALAGACRCLGSRIVCRRDGRR